MKTKLIITLLLLSFLTLLYTQNSPAQTSEELKALRKEIEALREGQNAIQKDLEEIKTFLRGKQPPPSVQNVDLTLSIAGDPFKGNKNARVALVEFTDYQCPFCSRHFRQVLPEIEKGYVQTGKVKYVMRNFPIESIHPLAFKAHEAASCAGEQGKYWEMHDRIFSNQQAMGPKELTGHAGALKLNMSKFQQCLDGTKHAAKIRKDIADGQKAGVQGTPTFFLAQSGPDQETVKVVRIIRGAQPYDAFKGAIDSLLAGQK